MKRDLETIWTELERIAGEDVRPFVERVDLDGRGRVTVCATMDAGSRWFQADERGVHELWPSDETRVPLARRIADGQTVLSYRPRRRIVLFEGEGGRLAVRKGFRSKAFAAAAASNALGARLCAGTGFDAPAIEEFREEDASLRMSLLPGSEPELTADARETWFRIGAGLRAFQERPAPVARGPFGPAEEMTVLAVRRERTERVIALPEGCEDLASRLFWIARRLPEPVLGNAHRDLHDHQLRVGEGRIGLLDFDLLTRADVALDAANLLAHLTLRALQGVRGATRASVNRIGEAFLEGLHRSDEESFWQRLRFYQATTFARIALVYLVRPRWSHLAGELLELARRCAEEAEREGRVVH